MLNGDVALITFTLSEPSTDFSASDITVSGGTLSGFSGSGTSYTATFTPAPNSTTSAVISVASTKFKDAAGNYNSDGSDLNNSVTIAVDTVLPDTTAPNVPVWTGVTGAVYNQSDNSLYVNSSSVELLGTAEIGSTVFLYTSENVLIGSTQVNQNGNWSYILNNVADGTYLPAKAKAVDAALNESGFGNGLTLVVDTSRPSIIISSNVETLSFAETAIITFTLSEPSTDFSASDITVSGGTLSEFSGSGNSYTATFTPAPNSTTNALVSVANNKFTDTAGNSNADETDSNNLVTISVNTIVPDSTPPTINITSSDLNLSIGETALITFTLSEESSDFTSADVVFSGGDLTNFTGSGNSYNAVFTPTPNSTENGVVRVESNRFSDIANNFNNDGSDIDNNLIMTINTVASQLLTGTAAVNTITGAAGNDTVIGLAGIDILNGADGSDIYVLSKITEHTAAEINDTGVEGIDEVRFSATAASTLTLYANDRGIETVVIGTGTGASANTSGTTALNINALQVQNALTITGNAGNNVIDGGQADDLLIGGAGNDTFNRNGRFGSDTMQGGVGNDIYYIDGLDDVVIENANEGTDLIVSSTSLDLSLNANVENLTLTGIDNITATGNALSNVLTGNAGNNILDGAEGIDTMIGGAGGDTYYVNELNDVITEAKNAGIDSVFTTLNTYTLGLNLEILSFDGVTSNSLTFTGNALSNTLSGSDGDDLLDGKAGADSLIGGAGDDTYYLDNVQDTIYDSSGIDTVNSLVSLTLANSIENLVLTGTKVINGTGNELDNYLVGNAKNNILIGGNGNDTLIGGLGKDTLRGDAGRDIFYFETGHSGVATTAIDLIQDYTKGDDCIDFITALNIGGSDTIATSKSASINQQTGLASFVSGSGKTLADALADISTSFTSSGNANGQFALFNINNTGNYYMFISDGVAGVGKADVLIQLVGITSVEAIDLTGGNLTILA